MLISTRQLSILTTFAMALASSLLGACAGDLPKATDIVHMRVLGARTEVVGDPERATPEPGETASLTFAMAFPSVEDSDSEVSSLFITCTAPNRFTGIPICQEFLDAALSPDEAVGGMLEALSMKKFSCKGAENTSVALDSIGITCVSGTPKVDVKIEAKNEDTSKLVRGILCQNGTPYLDPSDPELFKCKRNAGVKAKDAEAIAIYGTIPIQQKAKDSNDNPDIDDTVFELRNKAWPLVDSALFPMTDDDCKAEADAKTLFISDGLGEEIEIAYPSKAREDDTDGEPETLEYSTYTTAGEISQRFIVFDAEDKAEKGLLKNTLTWKMSKEERDEISSKGKLVRFFFTLLDKRGGFDVTTRAICVLP